ncbi:MAG TPA: class II aldolase/adducin family protein [Dongiaceae bacterium]
MSSVTTFPANKAPDSTERSLRVDLAAAFRLAVEFNWHESVGNHFSAAVSADGHQFLMNRKWMHFSQVTASNLLLLDVDDPDVMNRADAPDPSAWCIHGRLHALAPQARCILHLHPPYATALATLADPELKPIDQNTARFYGRIAIDRQFSGIADQRQEGERLAQLLGNRSVMLMGNHGVLVAADTIAAAFEDLYFLERACQTLILAYSTGQKLNILSPDLAEKTARDWDPYKDMALAHFAALKQMLDRKDPGYDA